VIAMRAAIFKRAALGHPRRTAGPIGHEFIGFVEGAVATRR